MDSPKQFLSLYGTPVPITVRIEAGDLHVIPPDADRYLLVLWATGGDVLVRYGEDRAFAGVGFTWAALSQPITFTHQLHGSLVASALTVGPMAARQSITYLVGRMQPIRRRPTLVKVKRATPNQHGQGRNGRR